MKQTIVMKLKQSEKVKYIFALATRLLICAVVSGCASNRVSMVTGQTARTPVKASKVKVFSNFKEIGSPWRIEGMFSNWAAPVANNTPQQREALIKETVAELGINAVVGLLPNVGDGVRHLSHTHGIMVTLGSTRQQDRESLPKFFVYLPPVNFKIERTPATGRLNDQLLEYVQHLLGYGKGYYAYYGNATGVDNISILQGKRQPCSLKRADRYCA